MGSKATTSYLVLVCGTGYALYKYYEEKNTDFLQYPYATFILILLNGIFSFYRHLNDSVGETILKAINATRIMVQTIAISCYVTEMWIKFGVHKEGNIAHAIIGCIVGLIAFISDTTEQSLICTFVNVEVLCMVVVGFMNNNYLSVGAAAMFGIGYFIYYDGKIRFNMMPYVVWNYFLGIFSLLAWFSLNNKIS